MKQSSQIEIDLEVYKALHNHINYIGEPLNDVLRRLLGLNQKASLIEQPSGKALFTGIKGVYFPIGMKLEGKYKGLTYEATVVSGGLQVGNKHFSYPSGAAMEFCEGSTDGWKFWHFKDPKDGTLKPIKFLQNKKDYLKNN